MHKEKFSTTHTAVANHILSCYRLLNDVHPILYRQPTPLQVTPASTMVFISESGYPWQKNEQTSFWHEALKTLSAKGIKVVCFMLPGYPVAIPPCTANNETIIDNVEYRVLPTSPLRTPQDDGIKIISRAIIKAISQFHTTILYSLPGYAAGYPALQTAHDLKIPLAYFTAMHQTASDIIQPVLSDERFTLAAKTEAFITSYADFVFVKSKNNSMPENTTGISNRIINIPDSFTGVEVGEFIADFNSTSSSPH